MIIINRKTLTHRDPQSMAYNENKLPSGLDELTSLNDSGIVIVQHESQNTVKKITKVNLLQEVQAEVDGKSDVGHTHDDRYFTEAEITALLSGKANTSHNHVAADITDFEEAVEEIAGNVSLDDYYTKTQADALLLNKSDVGHTHDDRYYTETEIDVLLAQKASTSHTHLAQDITDFDDAVLAVIGENADTLDELDDVADTIDYNDGYVLRANGSIFESAQLSHNDLADIGTKTHAEIDTHIADTSNPHSVTAAQVGAIPTSYLDTDTGLSANSDVKIPSQKAVKTYIDDATLEGKSWRDPVISNGDTTPPISPTTSDRHIVGISSTGAWSGHDEEIAEWNGSSWTFETPDVGWTVIVTEENVAYTYNGVGWVVSSPTTVFTGSNGIKVVDQDIQTDLSDTNPSLEISDGGLRVKVDGVTIQRGASGLEVALISDSNISGAIEATHGGTGLTSLGAANRLLGMNGSANALQYKSIVGGANTTVTHTDGQIEIATSLSGASDALYTEEAFLVSPSANVVWTNMPAALTELLGNATGRRKVDLSGALQYRVIAYQQVAGFAGSDLNVEYSSNNSTFATLGTSSSGELDVGTGTGLKVGAWTDIASGAKIDAWLRIVGKDGDGVVDPAFRYIAVQIKYNSTVVDGSESSVAFREVTFHSHPNSALAWANMPLAVTEFLGNTFSRKKVDLSGLTHYRIVVNQSVAGATNADLNLRYSLNGTTFVEADTAGAGEIAVGAGTGVKYGAWTPLVEAARNDVWITLFGKDGDGVVDPAWRQVSVQFKGNVFAPTAGTDTQVIFNDGGTASGDSAFTYNKTTDTLSVGILSLSNPLTLANGGTGNALTDPNANTLMGWDDTDSLMKFITIGSGLTYTHSTHTLSATGGVWGSITGTLSSQTDLQSALNAKQNVLTGLTSSVAELNILTGATLSTAELNYVDGVTSAIQGQIDGKQAALSGTGFVKISGTTISYDNSTYLTTASAAASYQPLDADLTTIAGLTATTDSFIVSVASAWASRTPAQVRTTLGLVIGTNVQAYDAGLLSIAGLTTAADTMIYTTGSDVYATTPLTLAARNLLDDTTTSAMRTTLGLAIGSDVQAYNANLATIAGLTATTDNFMVAVSSAWASRTPAQVRTTLGLVVGTNVQAYDAALASIASLTNTAGQILYTTGTDSFQNTAITSVARTFISQSTIAAMVNNIFGASSSGTGGAARIASPTFTGDPSAPTQTEGDNSTKLATTEYVRNASIGGIIHRLLHAGGNITAGQVAGTYGLAITNAVVLVASGTNYPILLVRLNSADYPTSLDGMTLRLRVRAIISTNDVAPGCNFTFGLYPITRPASSGGAGNVIYTYGTVVTNSTTTFGTPAADLTSENNSSYFDLPTAGNYALGVVTSGTIAASSHVHLQAYLDMVYI